MFYTVLITTSEVVMERTDKNVYYQVYKSFTCAIFRAVSDSCSSFFNPKPHGNAYYAG